MAQKSDLSAVIQDEKVLAAVEEHLREIQRSHEVDLSHIYKQRTLVADKLPCGLMATDAKGKIAYANNSAERLLGRVGDDLTGHTAQEILSAKLFRTDNEALVRRVAIRYRSPEEGDINLNCTLIPKNFLQFGDFSFCIVFTRELDVEEFKHKLTQSNRMAGIGTLARGVAHEFNNLIGGMLGYAQLAQGTDDIEDYRKCNEVLFEVGQRAQEIIGNLLAFARREPERIESIALRHLVEEVISLIERELKKSDIEVKIDIPHDCILNTDVAEFQHVLLNLFINAMHAMMDNRGGQLSISARTIKGNIRIEVQDTGAGINADAIQQIFDPFYTTKGSIGMGSMTGSGLGLSVCYGIVKKLGGDILVSSSVGKGTIFTVTLPTNILEKLPSKERETHRLDQSKAQKLNAKILVIDDEAIIRNLLSDTLIKDGYDVRVETNGFAAVERARHFKPDVAIIDAQMPGLSGLETYHELIREQPSIQVLVMTGKSGSEFEEFAHKIEDLGIDIIGKPFSLDRIRKILTKLIVAGKKLQK